MTMESGGRTSGVASTARAALGTGFASTVWRALTRSAWWPRAWPPWLLSALVLLALGQLLKVGLVSTDWWPVLSTNQVQNLSDFVRAFQEPIGAGDPHFIHETARHYRPLAVLSFALDYKLWVSFAPLDSLLPTCLSSLAFRSAFQAS